jgi:thymidylate synthase
MNNFEKGYSDIMSSCMKRGTKIIGRNGATRQISGAHIRANLKEGFPIVTGKQIYPKSCFVETEWLLSGQSNIKFLNANGVHIWDQWADDNGDLGPVYGYQLLDFNGINQFENVIREFKANKYSRRLLFTMWNPGDLLKMNLPPCHYSFQFVVTNNFVDIIVSMRSLDLFIGLPYDMVMYASILHSFANEFNLIPNEVIINAANAHVYEEHVSSAAIYCGREKFSLPKLINCSKFQNFKHIEMVIEGYNHHSRLIVNVIK